MRRDLGRQGPRDGGQRPSPDNAPPAAGAAVLLVIKRRVIERPGIGLTNARPKPLEATAAEA
jgi:hypothetical protein